MKEYFYKKEYIFLYLSKFCYALANSFIDIFGVVMLYKNGIPLYSILLIYGLRFGFMGLFSPLFITVSSKFGIANCALIANTLRLISSFMLLDNNLNNIFLFIIVMSLPGALSNPIEDAVSSKYVETEHRGRYNSIRNIARILGQAVASLIVAWGVVSNNNTILFLIISIFFVLDYLFIAFIDYKPQKTKTNVFKETINYILKSKSNYKIIYALRTNHIIERLFLPLYLYLALKDFEAFSIVITISLLLQIITVALTGKLTDKNIVKTNNIVTTIRVIITSIFLFVKNKILISINKTVSDNFEKVYETSIQTSIQNIIKESKENNEILSTVGQMSLCFTEIIVFSILALISMLIGEKVFYIIFILSILSTIIINRKIKNN